MSLKMNVCYGSKPDIHGLVSDVRCWGQSGHRGAASECLLLAISGHSHRAQGCYGEAYLPLNRALAIWGKAGGREHQLAAESLENCAALLRKS